MKNLKTQQFKSLEGSSVSDLVRQQHIASKHASIPTHLVDREEKNSNNIIRLDRKSKEGTEEKSK